MEATKHHDHDDMGPDTTNKSSAVTTTTKSRKKMKKHHTKRGQCICTFPQILQSIFIILIVYSIGWLRMTMTMTMPTTTPTEIVHLTTSTMPEEKKSAKIIKTTSSLKERENPDSDSIENTNPGIDDVGRFVTGSTITFQQQQKKKKKFISYQLYFNGDYKYNFTYGYGRCHTGETTNKKTGQKVFRVPLSSKFYEILNVTVTLSTNLKILSLGDSVGIQLHELLEEASGVTPNQRTVYDYAWGKHELVSASAPVRGGGALGALRMTGMFLEAGRGRRPANAKGGGWLPGHVQQLLDHTYHFHDMTDHDGNSTRNKDINVEDKVSLSSTQWKKRTVRDFDAMILRIPHGWLTLKVITEETLKESLMFAHKIFGIKVVVVMTLPFNNNIKKIPHMERLDETNQMIKRVISNWDYNGTILSSSNDVTDDEKNTNNNTNNSNGGVIIPLLLDFGNFTDQLMHLNAYQAGMNQTDPTYILQRLECGGRYPPSIAMICTDHVPITEQKQPRCSCQRNMVSNDGLHWCLESIGGRTLAAIACLLQCPLVAIDVVSSSMTETTKTHNRTTTTTTSSTSSTSTMNEEYSKRDKQFQQYLKRCEKQCNDRFMSLKLITRNTP